MLAVLTSNIMPVERYPKSIRIGVIVKKEQSQNHQYSSTIETFRNLLISEFETLPLSCPEKIYPIATSYLNLIDQVDLEDPQSEYRKRYPLKKKSLPLVVDKNPSFVKSSIKKPSFNIHLLPQVKENSFYVEWTLINLQNKLIASGKSSELIENLDDLAKKVSTEIRPFIVGRNFGLLTITGTKNASVHLGPKFIGLTPIRSMHLPEGTYQLKIYKRDYKDFFLTVQVLPNKMTSKSVKLESKNIGTIKVSSSPKGAAVYLGMKYIGLTPLTASSLPVGKSLLTIRKKGYITQQSQILIPETGSPLTVPKIKLEPYTDLNQSWFNSRNSFYLFSGLTVAGMFYWGYNQYFIGKLNNSIAAEFANKSNLSPAQQNRLDKYQTEINQYKKLSYLGLGLSSSFLIGSIISYFLYTNDLEKERRKYNSLNSNFQFYAAATSISFCYQININLL